MTEDAMTSDLAHKRVDYYERLSQSHGCTRSRAEYAKLAEEWRSREAELIAQGK